MKQRTVRLKAGMRVRVSATAKSPIAGCEGIVTYVGDNMCDVKVITRRKVKVEESMMDTLPKGQLESVYPNVQLVSLDGTEAAVGWTRWSLWMAGAAIVLVSAWVILHWVVRL